MCVDPYVSVSVFVQVFVVLELFFFFGGKRVALGHHLIYTEYKCMFCRKEYVCNLE